MVDELSSFRSKQVDGLVPRIKHIVN